MLPGVKIIRLDVFLICLRGILTPALSIHCYAEIMAGNATTIGEPTMKLYTFDTETGIYQGQDFGAESDININDGITGLAPPEYGHGQTPVYDFVHQHWDLVDNENIASVLLNNRLKRLK
jgi:hypothetical protein